MDIRNFFTATAMAKKRSSSGEGEPPAKKPTTNNKNKTDFSTIDFSAKDGDFKVPSKFLNVYDFGLKMYRGVMPFGQG